MTNYMLGAPTDAGDTLLLGPSTVERAVAELRSLREEDLKVKVMKPFFERAAYQVEILDRKNEIEHKLDLLLKLRSALGQNLFGVQLKRNKNITTQHAAEKMIEEHKKAFTYPHKTSGDLEPWQIARFYYITTGTIDSRGQAGIDAESKAHGYFGRIEAWDCERIVQELVRWNCHDLLRSLKLWHIEKIQQDHEERREGIFAAHCAYRAACWHLEESEGPNVERRAECARECLMDAIRLVDGDPRQAAFFRRTLRAFYAVLFDLLGKFPQAWSTHGLSRTPDITRYLDEHSPGGDAFLFTTYYSVRQLYQLEKQHVALPTGLASLQICNLLLRMGWSPILSMTIAKRIDDAAAEMNESGHDSIHNKCSLCTAAAVSCFTLANLERVQDHCANSLNWLRGLRDDRYCYHPQSFPDVATSDHALHYAAKVLIARCDDVVCRNADMSDLDEIIGLFFEDRSTTRYGFYSSWMRYRNISEFETCAYIFQGFLRLVLAGGMLQDTHRSALEQALINLIDRLVIEGSDTPASWRLYAVRENVGSLSLGLLLGVSQCAGFLKKVTDGWHKDLCSIYDTTEAAPALSPNVERAKAERLLDSNAGRLCVFLECLIQQWEGEILSRSREEGSPAVVMT